LFGCLPSKKYRVLHYSAEDGKKRLGHRMRKLLANLSLEQRDTVRENLRLVDASELGVLYGEQVKHGDKQHFKFLGETGDYYNLQKMTEAFDADVVVVDGASDTYDGNEIAKREVRAFIKLLKLLHPKRRIAVLLLVHIDRASARGHLTNDDGYSGSAAWHNSCRRRLYLQKQVTKDEEGDVIDESMVLKVMKNQDGPVAADIELLRDEHGFWFRPGDMGVAPLVEQAEAMVAQARLDPVQGILNLIDKYYQREKWIGTSLAANASTGVFATLKGDPEFIALKVSKKRTESIVRQLERDGMLKPEAFKNKNRKSDERWKVMKDPTYTLPTPAQPQE
jgi:RecA-family ATPase